MTMCRRELFALHEMYNSLYACADRLFEVQFQMNLFENKQKQTSRDGVTANVTDLCDCETPDLKKDSPHQIWARRPSPDRKRRRQKERSFNSISLGSDLCFFLMNSLQLILFIFCPPIWFYENVSTMCLSSRVIGHIRVR